MAAWTGTGDSRGGEEGRIRTAVFALVKSLVLISPDAFGAPERGLNGGSEESKLLEWKEPLKF